MLTYEYLTQFLMWCTIINSGLLLFWAVATKAMPDTIVRLQQWFVPLPAETITATMYRFMAVFKSLVLVLNVVPWLALLIIGPPA